MVKIFFEAIIFAIPIFVSNSAASISRALPLLKKMNYPLDFNKTINGERIFGKGKTIRGFIFGFIIGVISALISYLLFHNSKFFFISNEFKLDLKKFILLGSLQSFGALFGDLLKSFFKRRLHIKSGAPWPIFDQLDFIIGGLAIGSLVYIPPAQIIICLLVITPLLHLFSNIIAYKLKIKDVWW